MIDEYKISGFSDVYRITKCGKVISYAQNKRREKAVFIDKQGYHCVTLSYPKIGAGKSKMFRVHRLVATTFIPNPDNKPFVCHKDDNKENNCVYNLYWGTPKSNGADAKRNNVMPVGENHPRSKLTKSQVEHFLENYKPKCKENGLLAYCKKYGVSKGALNKVLSGENWGKGIIDAK